MEEKNTRKEEELAADAARRDGDMVEALINAYRPIVYALARKLCPQRPKDEDLLQCGLIGLWKAAERWDETRPFAPLARSCARSEMVNYLRRDRGRLATVSLTGREEQLVYEEDWSALELRDGAERAFPPGSRQRAAVLALANGEGLSRTAKALGVRRGRAKAIARRAYQRINEGET